MKWHDLLDPRRPAHSALCLSGPRDLARGSRDLSPWANGAGEHPVTIWGSPQGGSGAKILWAWAGRAPTARILDAVGKRVPEERPIIQQRGRRAPAWLLTERYRITAKRIASVPIQDSEVVEQIAQDRRAGAACIPRWFGDRVRLRALEETAGPPGLGRLLRRWVSLFSTT